MENLLRMDRIPHIWCPTCGLGTTVTALAAALEQLQLDQVELAVLLLQNGNSARAAQLLEPLAGDSTEWTGKIAALFLGRISPGDFLEDVSISYDDRRFYLAEFYRARGELQKSREALRFSLDESNRYDALFLSPLLCRLSQP